MEAVRVIIPSQESTTLSYMQRRAASPDAEIDARIDRFARGDDGLPEIDLDNPGIAAVLRGFDAAD